MSSDEIKEAMEKFTPVRFDGVRYERITAYIYRLVPSRKHAGMFRRVMEVELLSTSGKSNSVVIAPADKVEALPCG